MKRKKDEKINLSLSSTKSILVPITCMSAFGSINIFTPLSSTNSSNFPLSSAHQNWRHVFIKIIFTSNKFKHIKMKNNNDQDQTTPDLRSWECTTSRCSHEPWRRAWDRAAGAAPEAAVYDSPPRPLSWRLDASLPVRSSRLPPPETAKPSVRILISSSQNCLHDLKLLVLNSRQGTSVICTLRPKPVSGSFVDTGARKLMLTCRNRIRLCDNYLFVPCCDIIFTALRDVPNIYR